MICTRCGERPAVTPALTRDGLQGLCDPCVVAESWGVASREAEMTVAYGKDKLVSQGPTILPRTRRRS